MPEYQPIPSVQLCWKCKRELRTTCKFEEEAQTFADDPNMDNYEIHNLITIARIDARNKACPNLNNVDPDYPGKDKL